MCIRDSYYSAPYFFDFDLDDDMDLLVGGRDNHQVYINDNNYFTETTDIEIPYLGKNIKYSGGNLFSSNQFDLITGISTGGIYFLSEYLCMHGDLNQDQTLNVNDIILIVNIILGNFESNNLLQCSGDIDNNKGLNLYDIISLINLII